MRVRISPKSFRRPSDKAITREASLGILWSAARMERLGNDAGACREIQRALDNGGITRLDLRLKFQPADRLRLSMEAKQQRLPAVAEALS